MKVFFGGRISVTHPVAVSALKWLAQILRPRHGAVKGPVRFMEQLRYLISKTRRYGTAERFEKHWKGERGRTARWGRYAVMRDSSGCEANRAMIDFQSASVSGSDREFKLYLSAISSKHAILCLETAERERAEPSPDERLGLNASCRLQ